MVLEIGGLPMTPYVMGYPPLCASMCARVSEWSPVMVDIFDPAWLSFYRLVNAGNRLSYGGLGMPAWVQLDCCTMPSAMVGFAVPRAEITESTWERLVGFVGEVFGEEAERAARGWQGLVPVSEYCALGTPVEGEVVGFSLYALHSGAGLGVRTKALAMLAYGAQRQLGMTQYGNSAVRTHTAFGPLRIVQAATPPHSMPDDTFVYALDLRDAEDRLRARVLYGRPELSPAPPRGVMRVVVEPGQTARDVEALMAEHGPLDVVAPGLEYGDDRRVRLLVCPASSDEGDWVA